MRKPQQCRAYGAIMILLVFSSRGVYLLMWDDGESDEKSVVKTEESTEPVRISIVVKKENSEESEDPHALAMSRVFRVASELLSTEEQYVTVLYLIDQVNIHTID